MAQMSETGIYSIYLEGTELIGNSPDVIEDQYHPPFALWG